MIPPEAIALALLVVVYLWIWIATSSPRTPSITAAAPLRWRPRYQAPPPDSLWLFRALLRDLLFYSPRWSRRTALGIRDAAQEAAIERLEMREIFMRYPG